MRLCLAAFALFLTASASWCAELHTLKGQVIKGDLESISIKEIVLSQMGKRVATPLASVLKIEFPAAAVRLDGKYADVELTDGSLFHCKEWKIKDKQVELTTLAGPEISVPLSSVANVLNNASEEKYRKDWTERLSRKRRRDVIAVLSQGVVNPIEGTLGEANAAGTTIEFQIGDSKRTLALAKLHGLIFQREIDPQAPPILCKLYDNYHDLIMVSSVSKNESGLTVTTPAGAKFDVPMERLARLDYTLDKVAFLSRLDPAKVVRKSGYAGEFNVTYQRDKNLDNGPLRLYDEVFSIGLALHADLELEYDLKGDYREFHALAGIDQSVGGFGGPVVLIVEGVIDGQAKELYKKTFTRKDPRDKKEGAVNLNIKDVQTLRIIVRSGDLLNDGKHLDLVNAKVQK